MSNEYVKEEEKEEERWGGGGGEGFALIVLKVIVIAGLLLLCSVDEVLGAVPGLNLLPEVLKRVELGHYTLFHRPVPVPRDFLRCDQT